VRAKRTALAVLAVRPLFLVRAYSRAAALDTRIPPFPVLAFPVHAGVHDFKKCKLKCL